MRVEQRKLFEELGWESLKSAPGKPKADGEKKAATKGKKRGAKGEDPEDGDKSPTKKMKKGGKAAENPDDEGPNNDLGVKSEPKDDEM